MLTTLFAAAAAPATFEWSPKCALVMIACNVFAYAIARATIENLMKVLKFLIHNSLVV